jgi:hypothetical protein
VLPSLLDLPPHTGYGRVWNSTLPRLASMVDLVVDDHAPTSGCSTGTEVIQM